jgi:hypothetical protein
VPDHSTFGTIADRLWFCFENVADVVKTSELQIRNQDFREFRPRDVGAYSGNAFLDRAVGTLDEFRYLNTGFHRIEILDLAVTGSGEGVRTKPSGCS